MFKKISAVALTGLASVGAFAQAAPASPVTTLFAAIDLTTVAAAVLALGLLVIGIAMAFKGVDLSKRAVNKV